jgi:hypothetical protein
MATRQQEMQAVTQEEQAQQLRSVLIGNRVLLALGQPDNLQKVQVRPLWDAYYRVNVLVGADAASVTVAHSYFLMADGTGDIISSVPRITRQYQ